jgi:hypothetical protein
VQFFDACGARTTSPANGRQIGNRSADCGIVLHMALLPDTSHCIQRFLALCSARGTSYSLVWHSTIGTGDYYLWHNTTGQHEIRAITAGGLNITTTNTVFHGSSANFGSGKTILSWESWPWLVTIEISYPMHIALGKITFS